MNNFCPNCKADLRGPDIYQYFLDKYSKDGNAYPKTLEQILSIIENYPSLYPDDTTPSEDELAQMTQDELNAWYTASQYGWSFTNPKTFSNLIGIETPNYDGVSIWKCPKCNFEWKRVFN